MIIDEAILGEYEEKGIEYFSVELGLSVDEIVEYGLAFESAKHLLPAVVLFDYCVKNTFDDRRKWEIQSFKDRCLMKYYENDYYLHIYYSHEVNYDKVRVKSAL